MNAATNTRKRMDSRITRWTKNTLVTAVLLLSLFLCSCSADSSYHMALNGDRSLEISLNEPFTDPGVIFLDENGNAVSDKEQAKLKEELTITGLDQFDPSVPGKYSITYQYADQTLERTIEVLELQEGNTPPIHTDTNGLEPADTEDPADPGDAINSRNTPDVKNTADARNSAVKTAAGNNSSGSSNSAATPPVSPTPTGTSDPGSGKKGGSHKKTDSEKEVYILPSNVAFQNRSVTYDGKTHSITAVNLPDGITAVYRSNTGTNAGQYNASVTYRLSSRLQEKYSSVEPSGMTAALTIRRAAPTYTVPTGLTARTGQTLADIQLPKGFSFEKSPETPVGTAGAHVFKATYTPDDTRNYETVTGINITINVTGKNPESQKPVYRLPDTVTFSNRTETYTGNAYTVTAEHVPEGVLVSYSNAERIDAGTQTATVVFSLSDALAQNYSGVEPESMTAVLTVRPAMPDYTVPTGLTASEGQTLRDVNSQLSTGFSFEDPLTTSVGTPGNHEFTLTYVPGSNNYKTVKGIKVTIHVTKRPDPAKPKYIIPADVVFNNRTETYTGSAYTVTAEHVPPELTVLYTNNTRTDAGSQTATAEFRLSDRGLERYSGIEGPSTRTATLTIHPADPVYTVPTGLTAGERQTLADVAGQLPSGFRFEAALDTPVGDSGDHEFTVTYDPGSGNYKTVSGIKVTIHVAGVLVLPSNVTFPGVLETYDPSKVYTAEVTNLPDHMVEAVYTNHTRSRAGKQTARVEFRIKPEWKDRYGAVSPAFMETTINILKALPSYTKPVGLTAFEGQTLADIAPQLGKGFAFEDPPDTSVGREDDNNNFTVSYTPDDTENYQIVKGILVTIKVSFDTGPLDKTELNRVTALAEEALKNPSKYTAENFEAFRSAYHTASGISESRQQTINEKADAIKAALALLERETPDPGDVIDKSDLDQAVQVADALRESDWTSESYTDFRTAYEKAKQMPEDTQEEVDQKTAAINAALALLVVDPDAPPVAPPNRDELYEAISSTDDIDPDDYTSESYTKFENAFLEAYYMPEYTQEEVDQKTAAIRAAIALLVPVDSAP